MKLIKFTKERLVFLVLDIISIPSIFLNKEYNAKYHLKVVCPLCPNYRRRYREVNNKECWWEKEWKKANYNIPKTFGVKNYIKTYLGIKTHLEKFKRRDK